MASTDLRADSAHDNPAPADEFTEAFILAFDNWKLCDDDPTNQVSEIDLKRPGFSGGGFV